MSQTQTQIQEAIKAAHYLKAEMLHAWVMQADKDLRNAGWSPFTVGVERIYYSARHKIALHGEKALALEFPAYKSLEDAAHGTR